MCPCKIIMFRNHQKGKHKPLTKNVIALFWAALTLPKPVQHSAQLFTQRPPGIVSLTQRPPGQR